MGPSLDLDPTSLSVNAPMIMSLPELQSNLDEPDFAKNFRMDFSITQPRLDLEPSFSTDPLPALASSPKVAEDEGDQAAVIEVVEEDTDEEKPKKDLRNKRDVSKFPSIFSLMSSDHIPISFPTPDLTPRLSLFGELEADHVQDKSFRESRGIGDDKIKRQVDFFNFRPSKFLGQSHPRHNDIAQFQTPARRHPRQSRGRGRGVPVYPPFDPFNTTYIPLPGPSSPHYALKLQGDNPHMNEKARFISFRRPIRQSRKLQKGEVLPKMFQNLNFKSSDQQPTSDPFKYKSSGTFEKTQFFQSFSSKVPK